MAASLATETTYPTNSRTRAGEELRCHRTTPLATPIRKPDGGNPEQALQVPGEPDGIPNGPRWSARFRSAEADLLRPPVPKGFGPRERTCAWAREGPETPRIYDGTENNPGNVVGMVLENR